MSGGDIHARRTESHLNRHSIPDWRQFFDYFKCVETICLVGDRVLFKPGQIHSELLATFSKGEGALRRVEFWTSAKVIAWDEDLKVVKVRREKGGPRVRYLYTQEDENVWTLAPEDGAMESAHCNIDDREEMQ